MESAGQIESNRLSSETFMQAITEMTKTIVERTGAFDESEKPIGVTDILSPCDKKPLIETLRTYRSQDGKFFLYKTIAQRKLEPNEVRELLEKRKIGPLDNFRSKKGEAFSAMLTLDENNKVELVFDQTSSWQSESIDTFPRLIPCPRCQSRDIVETPSAYLCQGTQGKTCDFRISRTILGSVIPREQFLKLIQNRKTDLVSSFRSKRTGRTFSAHLILKKDSTIGFEFPPREIKTK